MVSGVSSSSGYTPVPRLRPVSTCARVTPALRGKTCSIRGEAFAGTAPHAVPGDRTEGLLLSKDRATPRPLQATAQSGSWHFSPPRVPQGPWPREGQGERKLCPGACGLPDHLQWGTGHPVGPRNTGEDVQPRPGQTELEGPRPPSRLVVSSGWAAGSTHGPADPSSSVAGCPC